MFFSIPQCLMCSAAAFRDIEHTKIRTVYHIPVADFYCRFRMDFCRTLANLYAIITLIRLTVICKFSLIIRQNPNQTAITIIKFFYGPSNCGGNNQVKITISPDKELYILLLLDKPLCNFIYFLVNFRMIIYVPMSEETNRVWI